MPGKGQPKNMKKTESVFRTLGRVLLLCLCMVLLAGGALANEVVDISTDGFDCLYYECTLPDGRLIFAGDMGTVGNYADARARLLCMNPDMTVSWDYVDPEEGDCRFWHATVLKDGTIATVLDNSPYQQPMGRKLKFFTQDGQPTGKEIVFSDIESNVDEATPSFLWILLPFSRPLPYVRCVLAVPLPTIRLSWILAPFSVRHSRPIAPSVR